MRLHEGSPFRSLALILFSCLFLCGIAPCVNALVEEEKETNYARDMIRRNIYPRGTREFHRYQNESSSRIVGGCEARAGFEYQCYMVINIIKISNGDLYILFCGCSLVDCKGTFVTAAHCCDEDSLKKEGYKYADDKTIYIYCDSRSPITNSYPATAVVSIPDGVQIYPAWDSDSLQNDICLLFRICTYFYPTREIKPIWMADPPMDPDHACNGCEKSDQEVIVSGVGIDDPGWTIPVIGIVVTPPTLPNYLQCVPSTVCSTEVCNALFAGVPCPTVTDDMMCMSGLKPEHPFSVSACNGDSGGPLIVCLRGKAVLIGVVSFGFGPANCQGYPSVFTRVSSYCCWIDRMIKLYQTCEPFVVPCEFAKCPTCNCKKG